MRINSVLLILLATSWGRLSAQAIEGNLLDARTRQPILLAQITLLVGSGQIVDQTYTDESGYFIVASEDPGSFFLRAERLGYGSRVDGIFDLGVGGLLTVEFRLMKDPIALDTLTVAVERRDFKLNLLGFYDRQRMGFGHFLGPEAIERRSAIRTTDLLWNIPRVRVHQQPFGQTTVTISGSGGTSMLRGTVCYPKVLVDGMEVFRGGDEPARLDDVVSPSEITAIEVFRSAAETPLQFGGASSPCGVILIWTR